MAWLPYSVRKTYDRRAILILCGVTIPHLLFGVPVLVICTMEAWKKPEASWSGEAGVWAFVDLLVGSLYLSLLSVLLFVTFGREVIHITDAGVRLRRELFGWAWKELFYPASSITGWTWSITFPWHRGPKLIKERSLSAYECRLWIQVGQRTSQPVLLTSRNGMDIADLCTALEQQWPGRGQKELFSPAFEEEYWSKTSEKTGRASSQSP